MNRVSIWNQADTFKSWGRSVVRSEATWRNNEKYLRIVTPCTTIEDLMQRFPTFKFFEGELVVGLRIYPTIEVWDK